MDRHVRVVLEAAVARFRQDMRGAAQTSRQAGREILDVAEKNREAFTQLGIAGAAAGAAIGLGLRKAGRETARYEATLTKSVTQIGVARAEVEELGEAALRLSESGKGPQDLAQALFFVQSAGARGAEAMAILEASAKASSIGLGDTAVVADLVTSAVNAYGSDVLSAAAATDVLIGAVREGKAEAPELAGSMGRVLPIASAMGVSFDQVGAAIAAMTRTGTNAAEATTQLRAIMVGLLKPAEDAEQALGELGLSSAGLRDVIAREGVWAALMQLKQAVGDNDAVMSRIFPNVRALAGVMDLAGASAATTEGIFDRMGETTGLLAEGFAEWSQTTEAAQARFSASMEAARISLGEGLQPVMRTTLDIGTGLAAWFTDLPGPVRSAAGVLGLLASALLVTGGAALTALPRINMYRAAVAQLGTQAVTTRTVLSGVGGFLMGPWGAALAVASVAVVGFAKDQAAARQRAEEWKASLDEATGAITDQTRALAVKKLVEADAAAAARQLGLSMSDVVDAVLGNDAALRRVNEVLDENTAHFRDAHAGGERVIPTYDENTRAVLDLRTALNLNNAELADAIQETRTYAELTAESNGRILDLAHGLKIGLSPAQAQYRLRLQEATDATNDALDPLKDLGDGYGDAGDEAETAADKIKKFNDEVSASFDPVFKANKAQRDLAEATSKVAELAADGKRDTDEYRRALQDQVIAALGLDAALRELQAGIEDGTVSTSRATDMLNAWIDAGWLSAEAAAEFARISGVLSDEIDKIPDHKTIELRADARLIQQALRQFDQPAPPGPSPTPTPQDSGLPAAVQHSGGRVGHAGAVRYHSGGRVGRAPGGGLGLRTNEFNTILERGELVLTQRQADALGSARVMPPASGGPTQQRITVELPVYLDGARIGSSWAVIDAMGAEVAVRDRFTGGG